MKSFSDKSFLHFVFSALVCALLVAAVLPGRVGAAEGKGDDGVFSGLFGDDFSISGGTMRYLPEKKAVLIRDYATILLKGKRPNEWRRLRARNILFFTELRKLYAEGDVSIEDDSGTFLNCDRMYFDIKDWKGRGRNIRMRSTDEGINKTASVEEKDVSLTRPSLQVVQESPFDNAAEYAEQRRMRMNVQASDLRLVSRDHFEATDVVASPSNYARPHWGIYSKAVHIRNDEKVEAYHNFFKIGKIPVFYFPYLVYDLKYNWPFYRTSFGNNKRQGYYWLNRFGWQFDNPTEDEYGKPITRLFQLNDIFVDVDARFRRGWSFGGETNYENNFLGHGEGHVKAYWTKEFYTTAGADNRRADEDVEFRTNDWGSRPGFTKSLYANKDRYMLEWWHRQEITDRLDLRVQTHWFSDRDFYKEYFPSDWGEDQEKLTNASLRYLGDLFQTEVIAQGRINDFRTQVEYLPEWRFSLPGFKLGTLPLYLENNTRAGLIRKRSDTMLRQLSLLKPEDRVDADGDTPWVGRVHNETRLSAPFDLGLINVRPYVGGFITGYSTSYRGDFREGDAKMNLAGQWGVDFSTRLNGELANGKFLHMVEPRISVIGNEQPLTGRSEFYDIDEVDNYRESHMTTLSLYQTLDVKNKDGVIRRLASLNVSTGVIMDQDEANKYNNKSLFSDITVSAALYPVNELSIWGNFAYSPAGGKVDYFNAGLDYWFSKKFRVFLRHSYDSGYNANDFTTGNESNITTVAARTQLWNKHSHYSLEYAISYEWNRDSSGSIASDGYFRGGVLEGLQSQRLSIIRDLDTFELAVNWTIDHLNSNNNTFSVNLTPKGWVGVKRAPDNTYAALDNNYGRYAYPVPQKMQKEDSSYNAETPAWE